MTISATAPLDTFDYYRTSEGVDDVLAIYCPAQDRDIATVIFWDCDPDWTQRSHTNARLLAAAPCLYNALREMLSLLSMLPSQALPIEMLQAEQSALRAIARVDHKES